jgi:hypothetical protein
MQVSRHFFFLLYFEWLSLIPFCWALRWQHLKWKHGWVPVISESIPHKYLKIALKTHLCWANLYIPL